MNSPASNAKSPVSSTRLRTVSEWTPSLKQRLRELEQRKGELETQAVTATPPPNLLLHPSMADLYRRKVEQLEIALNDRSIRPEASGILRSMIEHIRLTPEEGASQGLRVEVQGDLAAILAAASGKAKVLKKMDPATTAGSTAFQAGCGAPHTAIPNRRLRPIPSTGLMTQPITLSERG